MNEKNLYEKMKKLEKVSIQSINNLNFDGNSFNDLSKLMGLYFASMFTAFKLIAKEIDEIKLK